MSHNNNKKIQAIREEADELLTIAYMCGFSDGKKEITDKIVPLADAKQIANALLNFMKDYRTSVDPVTKEVRYVNDSYIFSKENLISLFLLKYGYDS